MAFSIIFERSGGFAGLTSSIIIDSTGLSLEEADKILKLIEKSDFWNYEQANNSNRALPDQFEYFLTIELDGKTKSINVKESEVSGNLILLFNYLNNKLRTTRSH